MDTQHKWLLPSPIIVFGVGLAVYCLIFVLAPVNPNNALPNDAIVALLAYNILFFCGLLIGMAIFNVPFFAKPRWAIFLNAFEYRRLLNVILLIVTIGIGFRLIDRILLRPQLLFHNIDTIETNSNICGFIASLLYPIGIALLPLAFIVRDKISRIKYCYTLFAFAFPAIDVMLVGKRGAAVVIIAIYFFTSFTFRKLTISARSFVYIVSVLSVFVLLMYLIFINRIRDYGFGICYSIYNSGYAKTIQPNDFVAKACSSTEGQAVLIPALTNFLMYYVHGTYEFIASYDFYKSIPVSLGLQTFGTIARPICHIVNSPCFKASPEYLFHKGVYTTFWGPLYVDFGRMMFPISMMLGFITSYINKKAIYNFRYIPLYSYICVVIFFIPVVNLIQSGLGLYTLVGCLVFIIISFLLRLP